MVDEKPAPKPTLAEERIAFLAEYLQVLGLHRKEIEPEPGVLNLTSQKGAEMAEWLRREEPEMMRAVAEIGLSHDWRDPMAESAPAIALALREWQRASEEAKRRVEALTHFRNECRRLEGLERSQQIIEQRGEGPAQRLAYGPNVPKLADLNARVYALRDELTESQPDVERYLRDVGQSLGRWSLAGGVLGIVSFVVDQVGRALGAYRRWPLSGPKQETRRMRDKVECARMVFQEFRAGYDEHLGTNGYWTLGTNGEDDPKTGLTSREWLIGAAFLKQKGLVEKLTEDAWKLTDDGEDVCAHPEQLDSYLGPRGVATPAVHNTQHTVIHGGNNQLGNSNTQNVTYQSMLTNLASAIEANPDIPADAKRDWSTKLREIASHPLTQTLLSAAAGVAAGK